MKPKKDNTKTNNNNVYTLPKKSRNEKEISVLDNDLKGLIIILKPSNSSKIYEKFE